MFAWTSHVDGTKIRALASKESSLGPMKEGLFSGIGANKTGCADAAKKSVRLYRNYASGCLSVPSRGISRFSFTGWPVPFKPDFGLSGQFYSWTESFPSRSGVFGSSRRVDVECLMQPLNSRSLHSTDHHFVMICSGRDDRVEESRLSPYER
jgi:hypothetical protein